jgi:hypothetical protein
LTQAEYEVIAQHKEAECYDLTQELTKQRAELTAQEAFALEAVQRAAKVI